MMASPKRINGHPLSCACIACEALDLHGLVRAHQRRAERAKILALEDRGHESLPYGIRATRAQS